MCSNEPKNVVKNKEPTTAKRLANGKCFIEFLEVITALKFLECFVVCFFKRLKTSNWEINFASFVRLLHREYDMRYQPKTRQN